MDTPSSSLDIGILTVIGTELQAVQDIFELTNESRSNEDKIGILWKGAIPNRLAGTPIRIGVQCIGEPGESPAAAATAKFADAFAPSMMVLCGIAAGARRKVKIGDVAVARDIADFSMAVAKAGRLEARPHIPHPPFATQQLLAAFRVDETKLLERVRQYPGLPPPPRAEEAKVYEEHVSSAPRVHDCTIGTSNLLLRDPAVLKSWAESHQGIRIGEMEAGGFVSGCLRRTSAVPWLVVRGVADFGDKFKGDDFHRYASYAAAAYVRHFAEDGFDPRMFGSGSNAHRQNAGEPVHRVVLDIPGMNNAVTFVETTERLSGDIVITMAGMRESRTVKVTPYSTIEVSITGMKNAIRGPRSLESRCAFGSRGPESRVEFV